MFFFFFLKNKPNKRRQIFSKSDTVKWKYFLENVFRQTFFEFSNGSLMKTLCFFFFHIVLEFTSHEIGLIRSSFNWVNPKWIVAYTRVWTHNFVLATPSTRDIYLLVIKNVIIWIHTFFSKHTFPQMICIMWHLS